MNLQKPLKLHYITHVILSQEIFCIAVRFFMSTFSKIECCRAWAREVNSLDPEEQRMPSCVRVLISDVFSEFDTFSKILLNYLMALVDTDFRLTVADFSEGIQASLAWSRWAILGRLHCRKNRPN